MKDVVQPWDERLGKKNSGIEFLLVEPGLGNEPEVESIP